MLETPELIPPNTPAIHIGLLVLFIIKSSDENDQNNLVVEKSIRLTLKELERQLENDTLAALSWLVSDGFLEFRFAVPKDNLEGGDFHSKLSLFKDCDGNSIALHGSQNDSTKASLNEESLSVFCSWNDGKKWHDEHREWFDMVWSNKFSNLDVLKVNEAARDEIVRYTKNENHQKN